MARFIEGEDRSQATLFPERLDDYIGEDNPVRLVEAFVDELELDQLGFKRCEPTGTGRPGYDGATLLKIHIYGYLNRIASGRRLERECQRNVELMWLTRRLAPDHKTLCEFRKDNAKALVGVCREFVGVCRRLGGQELLDCERVGITTYVPKTMTSDSKKKGRFDKNDFIYEVEHDRYLCPAGQYLNRHFKSKEGGMTIWVYLASDSICRACALRAKCTTGSTARRVRRWEHEDTLDAIQRRVDEAPEMMQLRRQTVEHPFGTLKAWMGATHFLTRTLPRVRAEMSLQVLAYNMKRAISLLGVRGLVAAVRLG